jgi:hypothetical protein
LQPPFRPQFGKPALQEFSPWIQGQEEIFSMKKPVAFKIAILLWSVLLSTSALSAPIGEHAGEIWISGPDQPGTNPNHPDADVNSAGRSVFVWDTTVSSTNRKDIFFRVFPADGSGPSDPVQVNTYVDNDQHFPKVAINSDGSFMVVWLSNEPTEPGSTSFRNVVRSQAFDANMSPVGDEQLLSTLFPLLSITNKVDLDVLPSGEYIVVWTSGQTPEPGDSGDTIQGRRIGSNGVPLAGQFQVNSTMTSAKERWPAVTSLADGGFLVVWTDPQVHGRQFASDFTPVGDDFQINTFINGVEALPVVDRNEDGRVLVVWRDDEETGDDAEIRGRLYSPELVPQGQDFRINTLVEDRQTEPEVADYGTGGFFVVWQSKVSAGNSIEPNSIEGRIVTGSDQFASSQFLVNVWTNGNQLSPGLGGNNGRIAVGWHSQGNPDIAHQVIQGQFWSICGIFCDGFE